MTLRVLMVCKGVALIVKLDLPESVSECLVFHVQGCKLPLHIMDLPQQSSALLPQLLSRLLSSSQTLNPHLGEIQFLLFLQD